MKKIISISILIVLMLGLTSCGKGKKILKVTAHRGASGLAPENTKTAIVKAMELGSDFSELDVQETEDGELILLHDGSLERTTNITGNIWEKKYTDLKDVDAGSWFSGDFSGEAIPTLESIIDTVFDSMKLNIELKMNGHQKQLTELVVDLITRKKFIDQCIVTSFDREAVRKVKELNPKIKTGYIFSNFPENEDIYSAEFDLISINKKLVTQELVDKAHKHGKEVHVWTVNKSEEMKRMIKFGVDSIITNYPDILNGILNKQE